MVKKRYNAKARQNKTTLIDNSATNNVIVEFQQSCGSGFDESNPLILPSKKRATKEIVHKKGITRILSKKQRKHLEKIVEKKKKKEQRSSLIENLKSVQVDSNELKKYTSLSKVQTVGKKKFNKIEGYINSAPSTLDDRPTEISIQGRNKRKLLSLMGPKAEVDEDFVSKKKRDLNVIGFEEESNSEDEVDEKVEEETVAVIVSQPELGTKKVNCIQLQTKEECKKMSLKQKCSHITKYVHVERDIEIQTARLKLPILAEEQTIMETINENEIIIIAGETGSGKTTQIPQFLYEAGYAEKKIIGITEPRRVAAISMSKRVAKEMNLSEEEVSYLIRFDGNCTDKTRIKFMTDGVLLKEIENDFLLKKYSVIILDEAHERSSYTDILIGLLSRIVPLRNKQQIPMKLIIMSATLKVEDFTSNTKLFKIPPPVINVESRQFPVTSHFQKTTPKNYVQEAYKKTLKIHNKLPEGGILIFLTGQKEVKYLVNKLRKASPCNFSKPNVSNKHEESSETDSRDEFNMRKALSNMKRATKKFAAEIGLPKINLDNYQLPSDDTIPDLLESEDEKDDNLSESFDTDDENDNEEILINKQPLWVLPLYSLLSTEKQNRIFEPVPENSRLCIVSTNVSETSLTIPNIKYVVDCGRQKTRLYDKITGVSSYVVTFTSKASADQRAGRAGRTSAGHCYRLYSSAVYTNEFEDFAIPDIQKKPVDDLILQMKCMGIDKVVNFPFPSSLDTQQLLMAEKRLEYLGALEECENNIGKVTKLGKAISAFPVAPRFGKMLALSHQHDLLQYTVALVSALSVPEVLMDSQDADKKLQQTRKMWVNQGNFLALGDAMILLRTVGGAEYARSKNKLEEFCDSNGVRMKAITEIGKLRIQLTNEINMNIPKVNLAVDPQMKPPTELQAKLLRQILLSGMGDKVAHKISLDELTTKEEKRKMKYAYNVLDLEEHVILHSSSVLRRKMPEWIVYQEAYEIDNAGDKKIFIRGISEIEPEWLLTYCVKLCNIKQVRDDPMPRYNSKDGKIYAYVEATFGRAGWDLPLSETEMPFSEKACRYFGMYFLNGTIFQQLNQFKDKLKSTPNSIVKTWSNLNVNLTRFVVALVNNQVYSKARILQIWRKDPNFLLQQFVDLLFNVPLSEVSAIWPPNNDD